MRRPLVYWPDPVLDTPIKPTSAPVDGGLNPLIDDMLETMRAAKGIGIAANQVGVARRLALVGREDGTVFEIINPVILEKSEPVDLDEGCLSVPGERETVRRYRKVKIRYEDRTGATHELEAEDYLAHVLQHEIDHLDGIVFVKHLSQLKRSLIRKGMLKRKARRHSHDDGCDDPTHDHG